MKHLAPEEIVDLAEGCAGASAAAHAAACDECRSKSDAAAGAIQAARAAEAQEPSPLFWTRLAAGIREAVRREPSPVPFWRVWGWRLAPAVAVLVLAVGLALRVAPAPETPRPDVGAPAGASSPVARDDSHGGEAGEDPSWLLMSLLSAEVSEDEAAASGALPGPGGTEPLLVHLDDAERSELARILRAELAGGRPEL